MIWIAIISATLTAICIWWTGRLYERASKDKDARSYTYIVEIEDEPEFKDHQLN